MTTLVLDGQTEQTTLGELLESAGVRVFDVAGSSQRSSLSTQEFIAVSERC